MLMSYVPPIAIVQLNWISSSRPLDTKVPDFPGLQHILLLYQDSQDPFVLCCSYLYPWFIDSATLKSILLTSSMGTGIP